MSPLTLRRSAVNPVAPPSRPLGTRLENHFRNGAKLPHATEVDIIAMKVFQETHLPSVKDMVGILAMAGTLLQIAGLMRQDRKLVKTRCAEGLALSTFVTSAIGMFG